MPCFHASQAASREAMMIFGSAALTAFNVASSIIPVQGYICMDICRIRQEPVDDGSREGGPCRAISEFLRDHPYEIDATYCDRYGHNVTGNPNGYLRKK